MGLEVTGLDVIGEDDVIGITSSPARAGVRGLIGRVHARSVGPQWLAGRDPVAEGSNLPKEELDFLPTTPDAAGGVFSVTQTAPINFIGFPQRVFRGERLIISAISQAGVDALFGVQITPAMFAGAVQIGAAQGSMPAVAFHRDAFGVRMSMPAMGQGAQFRCPLLAVPAQTGTNTITCSVGVIGRAVR